MLQTVLATVFSESFAPALPYIHLADLAPSSALPFD